MNMLASLKPKDEEKVNATETDSLGGGSRILDSGAYPAKITIAHVIESEGGAMGLALTAETEDEKEIKQTIYFTSGTAKGKKTYYVDSKTQENRALPGFVLVNSLCQLTTGKEIFELETEKKTIKLYNSTAKAEVPTEVQMLMDLIGQEVIIGLVKQTVNKQVKDEATGKYVPTADTRDENEIDKFFCAKEGFEKLTTTEVKTKSAGTEVTEPFYNGWVEKNAGVIRNKVKAAAAGTAGAPGASAAAGTPKPATSLFGKK